MLRLSTFIILGSLLTACGSDADDSALVAPPLPAATRRDFQRVVDDVVVDGVAPGVAISFERPGYAAWSTGAGVADVERRAKLEPRDRFRAGSMLKMATAVATLQLIERDELALDGAITDYLSPSLTERVPRAGEMTIRMLLNHSAGLPEWSDEAFDAGLMEHPQKVWTVDELLELSLSHPIEHAPGEAFAYSNTHYTLLGEILSRRSGKPWRQLLRERVFARAGMRESSLPEDGNVRCEGCARGYEQLEDSLVDVTEIDPSMAGPAGGEAWITTPSDVGRFLGALFASKLFDQPSTLGLMTDFLDAPDPAIAQTGYGFGLMRFRIGDAVLYGHLGGTAGYQAFAFFEPQSGAVITGNMNTRGDLGAFIFPVLDAAGRALGTSAD